MGGMAAATSAGVGFLEKANKARGYETYVAGRMGLIPILPTKASHLANAGVAIGGISAVGGGAAAAANHRRLGIKGHEKAVKQVNDWQKEMHEAFKGTKYDKKRKPYDDTYELVEYKNGKPKTIAKINGSHLTRNYKGNDKTKFMNTFESNPRTAIRSPKTNDGGEYDGLQATYTQYTGKQRKMKRKS